ncbi:MAG TPA: hypothetical protein VGC73_00495 [Pyrinomonadaceae bacterium]
MPAPLLTAIPTTQVVASGKDHQPVFKVIVLTFHKRFWLIILVHTALHKKLNRMMFLSLR